MPFDWRYRGRSRRREKWTINKMESLTLKVVALGELRVTASLQQVVTVPAKDSLDITVVDVE
jgi:hypothetical protein